MELSNTLSNWGNRTLRVAGSLLFFAGESDPADAGQGDKHGSPVLFFPGPDSQPIYTCDGNPHNNHLETAQEDST